MAVLIVTRESGEVRGFSGRNVQHRSDSFRHLVQSLTLCVQTVVEYNQTPRSGGVLTVNSDIWRTLLTTALITVVRF